MIQVLVAVCLAIIVESVASNPVHQVSPPHLCPICQQAPNNSPILSTSYISGQNDPYSQVSTIQSETPTHPGFDGTINQLLVSKILGNPCLRKLLDPNTKLYNQNGKEIQRNINTDAAPSVINNYFIVPPEFFCLNRTHKAKPKSNGKKRKDNGRNSNLKKNNIKNSAIIDNSVVLTEKTANIGQNQTERANKIGRKSKAKIKDQPTDSITKKNPVKDAKTNKTSSNKVSRNRNKELEHELLLTQSENIDLNKNKKDSIVDIKSQQKRRKRPKKPKNIIANEAEASADSDSIKLFKDDISNKSEFTKTISEQSSISGTKQLTSSVSMPYLQNIESPVDDYDITKKDVTENRNTRNSKNGSSKKSAQATQILTPEDYLKTFFPYLYFGNYMNPNGNYLFNFEQFSSPPNVNDDRRNKKRKNKTNQNNNMKKGTQPNVIKVKLEPKKKVEATTEKPMSAERTTVTQTNSESTEITTQSVELTNTYEETPDITSATQMPDDLLTEKPLIRKPKPVKMKANLEMPPTMLDEINEFMIPELEREDIVVPTIHTNGIINDYYPIFYDDPYYANEDSYYLRDIEDDMTRHFYTTDRNHEELSRDRRKYDSNDGNQTPNVNDKNNINFRHGSVYKERGKLKDSNENHKSHTKRPSTHEKIVENVDLSNTRNEEVQFVTPPFLENPDFRTKQIDSNSIKTDNRGLEKQDPIFMDDWTENIFEKSDTYPDIKSLHFSSLTNYDSKIKKEKLSTTMRPVNDHIETVFAKTRVVKYGVAKDQSEEDISVSMPTYEDDGEAKHFSDGHTTYVMAKSLGQMDDYFW